jgi:small redox-active disulfide protein 2
MNVKVLGAGCAACKSLFSDVQRLVARLKLDARVEYVTDVEKILSYDVMSIPVLVIDEQVVMIGYRGAKKIEAALQQAADMAK